MNEVNVLLDARVVERGHTGIARYVRELAPRLAEISSLSLTGIRTHNDTELPGVKSWIRARSEFLNPAEQLEVPLVAAGWRARHKGVVWFPAFNAAALSPAPFVLTLHDANHLALPANYSRAHAIYYRTVVRMAALRAAAVITVSEFSRREIVERIGVPESKVHVILNGVTAPLQPTPEAIDQVRAKFKLPEQYAACVSNFKPHKNIDTLLRAMEFTHGVPLVLIGGDAAELSRPPASNVFVLGKLRDEELWPIVAGAGVFVFPSQYEGFGLPPLEAMSLGVPVVCSTAGALREVVGDAALLIDPDDAEGFGKAIDRVLGDADLAKSLAKAGRERAAMFRWDTAARQHARVLMDAVRR